MARFSGRVCMLSALLVLATAASWARADDFDDDSVTVETEEEEDLYHSPTVDPNKVYLAEHFDDEAAFNKRWMKSQAKKQGVDENLAKYDGVWEIEEPSRRILRNDLGLVLKSEAKHAAIAALLDRPFEFTGRPLVVQYEVTMQEGQNCGGAYIKLLSRGTNNVASLRQFHDQTPYTVMFGPDKCGNDNKLHFIFRHVNPNNGTIEEKHCKKPTQRLDDIYKDKEPHLYTLIIRPDNTFNIYIDHKEVNSGSLLEDFTPPVNPPEEVDDPDDVKPDDWDEREKIVDPAASKPDEWDEAAPAQIVDPNAVKPDGWLDHEPNMIPDPEAVKPADWDEEMDGEWEAPLIDNPACSAATAPGCGEWAPPTIPNPDYKGPWRAPLIANPNYRGKWSPRRIPNPHYFRDDTPYRMTPIHAVGFELWSMSPRLLFDNLLITDDPDVAHSWAQQTFDLKRHKLKADSQTLWGRILRAVDYKPGWWAAYAVYCAIPITAYIALLVSRAREESVVDRALSFAGENPWVYAVLAVAVFLLAAVLLYLCCGSSAKDTEPLLDPKKTDAYMEDDAPAEEDDEGEGEAPEAPGEASVETPGEAPPEVPPRATKADLEPPAAAQDPESAPQPDSTESVDAAGGGDGHRKRKPRRE